MAGLTGHRIDVHDDSYGSRTQDVVWQIRGEGLRDRGRWLDLGWSIKVYIETKE
jgi:hypothetical protein